MGASSYGKNIFGLAVGKIVAFVRSVYCVRCGIKDMTSGGHVLPGISIPSSIVIICILLASNRSNTMIKRHQVVTSTLQRAALSCLESSFPLCPVFPPVPACEDGYVGFFEAVYGNNKWLLYQRMKTRNGSKKITAIGFCCHGTNASCAHVIHRMVHIILIHG